LRINSPGGDVFDGVGIHNTIRNHPANVTAYVDGIAASAASYIAMAADKIIMPANSFLLVHGASGFSMGNADDMRSMADDLDRIDKSLTATYAARSKKPEAKVRALMKEDRLMSAAEAKEFGLADEVAGETKMAAKFSLRLLPQHAAQQLKAALKSSGEPEPPPALSGAEPGSERPVPGPAPSIRKDQPKPEGGADVINLDDARRFPRPPATARAITSRSGRTKTSCPVRCSVASPPMVIISALRLARSMARRMRRRLRSIRRLPAPARP
jgi:ATP-dependent Clp protease protease subunit